MKSSLFFAFFALQGALVATASSRMDAPHYNAVRGSQTKETTASGTKYVYAKLPNGDGVVQGIELPQENVKVSYLLEFVHACMHVITDS